MSTSLFSKIPTEVEQGYIRLLILSLFTIYLFFLNYDAGANEHNYALMWSFLISAHLIAVTAQFLLIHLPAIRISARWILQVLDLLMATITLFLLGDDGHLMFFIYLFVSIGYGIRYSLAHLKFGLVLSLTFYTVYIFASDSIPERGIILGNYALLIILPPYIASLINILNEALEGAKASNRAKTMFLANISHELRTPLVGVVTASELMETRGWNDDNLSLLGTIKNSSEVLTTQINRILDFARIESGGTVSELQPILIRQVLDDCISIFIPQAKKKGIDLVLQVNHLPACITGDDASIRQIFINIVGNAIKFTETGYVEVQVDVARDQLFLTVIDTGIGIPANKIQTVFDPFMQADGTITKKYGGTGLGTAITKQLVDKLGGEIKISSTEGAGTTVQISLPCNIYPEKTCIEESTVTTPPIPVNTNASILVADDNLTNQYVLRMMLKKSGFTNVDVVDNGEDALASMLRNEYDLVILDRHMPGMGGGEALRKYKQSGKDVLSIFLTADQTQAAVDEFNASGFTQLIIKPFNKDRLHHAINSLLSSV